MFSQASVIQSVRPPPPPPPPTQTGGQAILGPFLVSFT